MSTNKDTAIAFLTLASAGQVEQAFDRYAAPNFRHHNAYFAGDRDSLMRAMADNAKQVPDKKLHVKRALEDGDLVAVHSHVLRNAQDPGVALVHIFRFERGRIAELWDIGQPVPKDSPNANGMF